MAVGIIHLIFSFSSIVLCCSLLRRFLQLFIPRGKKVIVVVKVLHSSKAAKAETTTNTTAAAVPFYLQNEQESFP
jgi:hypothetical protein